MRALLDVNVLIALLDPDHTMHERAMSWLSRHVAEGWASCPLTQNGCVRIMSQPAYPAARPAAQVAERLAEACTAPEHQFWPADISLLGAEYIDWHHVLGHRQVRDAYLLALAVRNGGRFVTFDRRISLEAARGATPDNLLAIS